MTLRSGIKTVIVTVGMLYLGAAGQAVAQDWTASSILYNGKICTVPGEGLFVEALAIKGQIVRDTGSLEELLEHAGPETEMIDLQGHTVIPGINDAHVHVAPLNLNGIVLNNPYEFLPGPGPSLNEFLGLIAGADAYFPPEQWFYLVIGETVLDDPSATRFALDTVAPNRPVIMLGWTGHQMHINTAAMEAVGLSETEPNPFGGAYERLEGSDVISGVLQDYAVYHLLRSVRMSMPSEIVEGALIQNGQAMMQLGITSVQDMGVGFTSDAYTQILENANLPIRVRNIAFPLDVGESQAVLASYERNINPDSRVIASGLKWIFDGTPLERHGALRDSYFDRPGWNGLLAFSESVRDSMMFAAQDGPRRARRQHLIHATGDRTVDAILDSMSAVATDRRWEDRRFRIEHGDMIMPDHIPELLAKQIIVVQNPSHFAAPEMFFNRVGPERFGLVQPVRSLLDSGVKMAFGSDSIGVPPNPYFDMMMAVLHPTNPSEAITLPEALSAYTEGGAYAEFMERKKGTLEQGKYADLAVLSQDIFDPTNFPVLEDTYSVLTVIDGEVVWDAGVLDVQESVAP